MQRLVLRQRGAAGVAREALRRAAPCWRSLSVNSEASHPQPEASLPLAPPTPPAPPSTAAPSPLPTAPASVSAAPPPTHAALSAEEQEELYRQGGRELSRAWEREGGVKPGLARFERLLHTSDLDEVERAWKELRKDGMEFEHFQRFITMLLDERYLSGWGMSTDAGRRRARLAWDMYEHMLPLKLLSAESPVPAHYRAKVYNALLRAFALLGDGWRAKELAEHMEASNFLPFEEAMSNMVVAMAKSRIRHEAQEQFDKARRRGMILSNAAKAFLIATHARAGDGQAAANVLDVAVHEATLNDNPGEVSGNMVKKVLEVGIETADVDVLRRGLGALSVPVDRGMGLQILNVAARHGDGQLAMDMFYAMESWGYTPSASAFNAVVQALALSRNDVAMLKALNEMCAWGLAPSEGTLHLIARQLSSSVARLDEAYTNLLALKKAHSAHVAAQQQQQQQQQQHGTDAAAAPSSNSGVGGVAPLPVAPTSVYLIVLGCAYANQLDRAFATFEDYGPVFGLAHDARACNALLLACLRARSLQVGAAFSVMTEMERLHVAPDQETCHLMVRILVQAKEADGDKMEEVLTFMERQGVQPRADTLRLLALWHALTGDHDRATEILSALQAQGAFIPSYLPLRLEQIRDNGDRL